MVIFGGIFGIIILIAFAIVWIPVIISLITRTDEDKKRQDEMMKQIYPTWPDVYRTKDSSTFFHII
jgi:uncharacterized alpha/beta hydrolase family protein